MDNTATENVVETKKGSGGTFLALSGGVLIGVVALFLLCCCACAGLFAWMTTTPEFKNSYCESWLEDNADFDDEPFGWCEEYPYDEE